MDYKHELEFGLFLNPDAHDPQEVLRVARLADSLGLDFVAIQDHRKPWKPRPFTGCG